jgi:putative transcriptional regulator
MPEKINGCFFTVNKKERKSQKQSFTRSFNTNNVLPLGIICIRWLRNDFDMLNNTVAKWRRGKKISKAHLARQIGVCRSYVTKLEQGKLQPSGEVMFRIAAYFKVRIEDIFERAGSAGSQRHFFSANTLPNGNTLSTFAPAPARPVRRSVAAPPACPAGVEAVTDRSLVGPTAKVVASLSRSKPNGKS